MARLELIGILFIVTLGTILHYTFDASGNLWWVGIFSAMNESVWEHLKLAFWPSLFWTIILNFFRSDKNHNFWLGRALALISTPVLIAVGFYWYTAALGHHALVYDLILFVVAIAVGQFLAILAYRLNDMGTLVAKFAIALLVFEVAIFVLFSFVQPGLPIFADPTA